MGRPSDKKIEQCLRRIVRVYSAKESLTVRAVREQAEKTLKLEDGFLKSDSVWKQKSKEIIYATMEEPEEEQPSKSEEKSQNAKQKSSAKRTAVDSDAATSHTEQPAKPKSLTNGLPSLPTKKHLSPRQADGASNQINGVKRKASEQEAFESESNSGREEKSENELAEDVPQRKRAKKDSPASAEAASSSESEKSAGTASGSESSESGEDSGDEEEVKEPMQGRAQSREATPPSGSVPEVTCPKSFRVPVGYSAIPRDAMQKTRRTSLEGLESKQIWHITAPADVPLPSVTRFALDAIKSGEPILAHDGVDYILDEDENAEQDNATVLVSTGDGYRKASGKVDRTLHLRQKIVLPYITAKQTNQFTGSAAAADVAEAAISHVRRQPAGLRMRYKPPGYGPGRPGRIGIGAESDADEDSTTRPELQFPGTLGGHGVSQGQQIENQVEGPPTSTKKTKKKRKNKDGEADDMKDDETVLKTPGSSGAANVATSTEVDKVKRMEQKRARKEMKRKGTGD